MMTESEIEILNSTQGDVNKNNHGYFLNKGQYANLIQQVVKEVKMGQGSSSSDGFNARAIAGTLLKYIGSCFSAFNFRTWIIDFLF